MSSVTALPSISRLLSAGVLSLCHCLQVLEPATEGLHWGVACDTEDEDLEEGKREEGLLEFQGKASCFALADICLCVLAISPY